MLWTPYLLKLDKSITQWGDTFFVKGKRKEMYDLDWAKEVCNDLQHARPQFKESLRELVKITAIYAGALLIVGGSSVLLNYVASKYNSKQEIKSDTKTPTDTLEIKKYTNKKINDNMNTKHR